MNYISTNLKSKASSFRDALLAGLAPDKGLFVPERIPRFERTEITNMSRLRYNDIAFVILDKFLAEEMPSDDLRNLIEAAYDFRVPIEHICDSVHILRLDRGPTASFKDFAARMMARLMSYFIQEDRLLVLVATSGDTGGAIADAFYGSENIDVVVLFPKDGISPRQRKQMTTLGKNITAVAVRGQFDDCQALVKEAFQDGELRALNLSSANSINIGRLLPQAVYYFYAYSRLDSEEVIFSVPSGNFGNLVAGIIAREMGLPSKKFIVSVNENDEFPRFVDTGNFEPVVPSRRCLSSAMNVGNPSNLARLVNVYGGLLDDKGHILSMPDMDTLRKDLFATSIDDDLTKRTIASVYENYNTVLEPHGAVAWAGLMKYLEENVESAKMIVLETAHPAKFPQVLNELGIGIEMPRSLEDLDTRKEIDGDEISTDYTEFKELLLGLAIA